MLFLYPLYRDEFNGNGTFSSFKQTVKPWILVEISMLLESNEVMHVMTKQKKIIFQLFTRE